MSEYLGFEPTQQSDFFFVSYNSEDVARVSPLVKQLCANGIPLWYDYGLEYGKEWKLQITERIDSSKAVILFFSKGILGKEKSYVRTEYEIATFLEKKIYVVIMDAITRKEIPLQFIPWYLDVAAQHCVDIAKVCDFLKQIEIIENALNYHPATRQFEVIKHQNEIYSKGLKIDKLEEKLYILNGIGSCKDKSVKIPPIVSDSGSVILVGDRAFYNCGWINSVIIPNGVTAIGTSAFFCCNRLTSITIPNSVVSIGEKAFYGCESLASITIPDKVTTIEARTFRNCERLTSITIPNCVKSIGVKAFSGCINLTSIVIPNGVTIIEEYAFSHCSNLSAIIIPNSVTVIGKNAFSECNSITIYCQHSKKPDTWDDDWNLENHPVVWKYTP